MARLSEQAFDAIEHRLVTMRWAPGEVLTESRIIEAVEIGRTPVREAVQRLAAYGLLQVLPRKGLVVTGISRSRMLQLLAVRRQLECWLVAEAAARADAIQRGALERMADRTESLGDDEEGWFALDHELDALLAAAAGNDYATRALAPLLSHSRRFWWYGRARLDGNRTRRAHARLARQVAAGDRAGAAAVCDGIIGDLEQLAQSIDSVD